MAGVPTIPWDQRRRTNVEDWMFRQLDAKEEESFRKWARKNWEYGKDPDMAWHPVVRNEWAKITREFNRMKEAANEHR